MNDTHLARAPRRRPTAMDRVRVREFALRLERGEHEVDAFWAVISHPGTGYSRFRGVMERPPEIVLRRKLAALLERACPQAITEARHLALARLAGLSDPALNAVGEILRGEIDDGRLARARLDAARVILASLGISDRGGMTVATQVNVERAPGFPMEEVPEGV